MNITPCRSCGARLFYVPTAATGALMPLNAEAMPDGNVAIVDGKAVVLGNLFTEVPDGPRYMVHWKTCSNPARHRKAKR